MRVSDGNGAAHASGQRTLSGLGGDAARSCFGGTRGAGIAFMRCTSCRLRGTVDPDNTRRSVSRQHMDASAACTTLQYATHACVHTTQLWTLPVLMHPW